MIGLKMWNLCNSSRPSRKLIKAQKTEKQKPVPLNDDYHEDSHHPRLSPDLKAITDFESDIAWVTAWENRKKIRVFYCSRVLRKLRRRVHNTASS
jgi:hypothetical protein